MCGTGSSSPPRPNGCSTTSTWSRPRSATSASICPRTYYRELPSLASREQAGDARIYAMAVELVRHSDSRIDRQQLAVFLNSYQRVAPLTIGELWAWPSMLKLALIENLRRLADETLERARGAPGRRRATSHGSTATPEDGVGAAAAGRSTSPPSSSCCIASREYGLRAVVDPHRGRGPPRRARHDRRRRDPRRASAAGRQPGVGRQRHYQPAPLLARSTGASTSSRSASSSRCCSAIPPGVYGRMDFLSRDRQRQAVEELAAPQRRRAGPRRAESRRKRAAGGRQRTPSADRAAHVGYHLIDRGPPRPRGRRRLSAARLRSAVRRLVFAHATLVYLAPIALLTAAAARRRCGVRPRRSTASRVPAGSRWSLLLLIPASRHRDRARPARRRLGDPAAPPAAPRLLGPAFPTTRARWSSCRRC